jgi:LysR family nitrogen assimilation transcriptional regulator
MISHVLSREGLSLERLNSFRAVADAGSIAKAAEQTSSRSAEARAVRQSLISRQIRELEERFRVELVRRSGRGLVVTDAGRKLAALIRDSFRGLADFEAECRAQSVQYSVTAPNSLIQWLILRRWPIVSKSLPGICWTLFHDQSDDLSRKVQEGVCDFGLAWHETVGEGLEKADLGTVRWVLVIPEVLGVGSVGKAREAFRHLPLAMPIGGKLHSALEQWAGGSGPGLNISLGCTSYMQAFQAVCAGTHAAVLPDIALVDLHGIAYRTHALPPREATRRICLIWTRRMEATRPSASKVLACLKKAFHL